MEDFIMSKKMTPKDNLMKAIFGKQPEEMTEEEMKQWISEYRKRKSEQEHSAMLAEAESLENMTDEEIEREIEDAVNNVTDEQFKETWGCSIEESVNRTMLHAGWCEAVVNWQAEHMNDRKYHTGGDFTPVFSLSQVIDMAQLFYRQGFKDGKNGTSEYDRLWKLNREKKRP